MIKCPLCGGEIKKKATRCKHCREEIDGGGWSAFWSGFWKAIKEGQSRDGETAPTPPPTANSQSGGSGWLVFWLVLIGGCSALSDRGAVHDAPPGLSGVQRPSPNPTGER